MHHDNDSSLIDSTLKNYRLPLSLYIAFCTIEQCGLVDGALCCGISIYVWVRCDRMLCLIQCLFLFSHGHYLVGSVALWAPNLYRLSWKIHVKWHPTTTWSKLFMSSHFVSFHFMIFPKSYTLPNVFSSHIPRFIYVVFF